MIAKHSHEQSQKGEGVEVVENKPHEVKYLNHTHRGAGGGGHVPPPIML